MITTRAALCFVLVTVPSLAAVPGCGGPPLSHPAIGRVVGNVPLVSATDPSRPPPSFTGKVTLLNFWGTWCPPCRRELPGLARIAGRLEAEPAFQLVAVSCGAGGADDITEITETTLEFLAAQDLAIDPWIDPDGLTRMLFSESYGFTAYPTTYLIGADARIRHVWTGYRSRDEAAVARAVVEALKASADPAPTAGSAAR